MSDSAAHLATRMLVAALFALAFNLLWQNARLLSFGHGVYLGAGMFTAIHLMRAAEAGSALALPLPLVPLAAAAATGIVGLVLGLFATVRSGTYFAMITLAMGELAHALGPRLTGVFGGESGMSTMRMPWGGFSFGSMGEVYCLTLAWVLAAIALLRFFAETPLGRITFALGDNEQRLRALGYRTHLTKTALFTLSAAMAGLAGGLLAVANENVDYEIFAGGISAQPVLQVFIGGASTFFGPAFGAVILTWIGSQVSNVTRLWLLYQGILFVLVVLYAPEGVAGLVARERRHLRRLGWRGALRRWILALAGGVLLGAATVFSAEAVAILLSESYAGQRAVLGRWPDLTLFGALWPARSVATWIVPVAAALVGAVALRLSLRRAAGTGAA